MSNNAAVTADGGEIGRAQALQARAARRAAERAHEPGAAEAAERDRRADRRAGPRARHGQGRASIRRSKPRADAVRAGQLRAAQGARPTSCWSRAPAAPSEINLRADDIANMGFARAADVPVVLVGDIDRGGVIASLVGTKAVLDAGRRGADRAASSSTSSAAIRRCSPTAWRRSPRQTGWRGARPRAVSSPTRGCLPAEDALALDHAGRRSRRRGCAIAVPDPAAYRQFRRSRSARRRARGRARPRAPGRGAARRCRPRHPAGLEGHHRRSRRAARGRLGHRHRRASAPRRPRARPVRRLSDARARDRRSGRHRRAGGRRAKGSACSTSRRC